MTDSHAQGRKNTHRRNYRKGSNSKKGTLATTTYAGCTVA
jgi:hypothetical protein